MKKLLFILVLSLTFFSASCGGGSSSFNSRIEGTWRGDLLQGAIFCTDGEGNSFGIGAGAGSVFLSPELLISGTDEVGSIVQVIDGDCILEGLRTDIGFQAMPVSGCPERVESINFSLREEENTASVSYRYESSVNQDSDTSCNNRPSGILTRS